MYCSYCGAQRAEEARPSDPCPACGELGPGQNRGPWPALFLGTLAILLVLVAVHFGGPERAAQEAEAPAQEAAGVATERPVALPDVYTLPVRFEDIGPRLLAAGAIDLDRFAANYRRAGQPLDERQMAILNEGSDEVITIDHHNAYFLLNFFWALGLTNDNPLLTEGEMMAVSDGDPSRYASVGGWTLGQKPAAELYASAGLVQLTAEQQVRVRDVAEQVYRPCCNNHTALADCNHGMALLGLLQHMAGQNATEAELYKAAKYVSAFWFPQQALEAALFFNKTMGLTYAEVEPQMAVSPEVFSAAGFQQVHQWLVANEALPQPSGGGNSCGV